jgi:hypothetical protein
LVEGGILEEAGTACDSTIDLQNDPLNCGTCQHQCSIAGAIPKCEAGVCKVDTCIFGRWDLDGNLDNGCEYACVASDPPTEICNYLDDDCNGVVDDGFDTQTDNNNCGVCGNVCALTQASSQCTAGGCVVTSCNPGFWNLDKVDADGCEYTCTQSNGGVEICDGQDNDCNGTLDDNNPEGGQPCNDYCPNMTCTGVCTPGNTVCVAGSLVCVPGNGPQLEVCNGIDDNCDGTPDDGFDLTSDPHNCGMCGNDCTGQFPNGLGTCVNSACVLLACNDGFKDYDPNSPGCEQCPVWPTSTEVCNGKDDDCDGVKDNGVDAQKPSAAMCKNKPGTPCATAQVQCNGTNGWGCVYDNPQVEVDTNGIVRFTELLCDGHDGNCDGNIDEAFASLGAVCDNGKLGACKDIGKITCDPADATKTKCDLSVKPDAVPGAPFATETCNGVDDDCNGQTDENTGDLVRITRNGLDFYIDRYEASRPDASSTNVGLDESHVCTNKSVLPWANASYSEADTACKNSGKRLCTAAEMLEACQGAAANTYPYAGAYAKNACNGLDNGVGGGVPTGSLTSCVSTDGVYDLSGNVNEWTSTVTGNTGAPLNLPIQSLQGGSYESPANGLTCGFDLDRISTNAVLPSLGFRCCKDP